MAKLVFNLPFMQKEYLLDKDVINLGRLMDNDISIPDYSLFQKLAVDAQRQLVKLLTKISRKHSRITRRDGHFYVEDIGTSGWGSSYGTYVNEARLDVGKPYLLKNGDRVKFGPVEGRFQEADEDLITPETSGPESSSKE